MSHIFISYSRADEEYVARLNEKLKSEGFDTWLDGDIPPGDKWADLIFEKLKQSAAMIVVMSESSHQSIWVKREILNAQDNHVPVFPLLLSGMRFDLVAEINFEDVTGGLLPTQRFYEAIRSLLKELSSDDHVARTNGNRVYNEKHRAADFKLLSRIWIYIKLLNEFGYNLENELVEHATSQKLTEFMFIRSKPEHTFNHLLLEEYCLVIDQILIDVLDKIFRWFHHFPKERTFLTYYSALILRDIDYQHEDYNKMSEIYEKHSEYMILQKNELLNARRQFIVLAKRELPEFDFSEDIVNLKQIKK